jgi:hypothetical protein
VLKDAGLAGTLGRATDDIFPDLHVAKMTICEQKKKLKPVLFLIFIDALAGLVHEQ